MHADPYVILQIHHPSSSLFHSSSGHYARAGTSLEMPHYLVVTAQHLDLSPFKLLFPAFVDTQTSAVSSEDSKCYYHSSSCFSLALHLFSLQSSWFMLDVQDLSQCDHSQCWLGG